jgi:hypothetical protein
MVARYEYARCRRRRVQASLKNPNTNFEGRNIKGTKRPAGAPGTPRMSIAYRALQTSQARRDLSDSDPVTNCSVNGCGNVTAKNKTPADAIRTVVARLFSR